MCTECNYPIGLTSNPSYCITDMATSKRVVPEYSSSATKVDWRDWGIFGRIRNQSSCGSCYCFAAIGAAEATYAIKTGQLYNLSEQHILDCSANLGCDGGWMTVSNSFLAKNGVILESDYPYKNSETSC